MTRLVMLMVAVIAFGCTPKPSEEECRKAIANMQTLMGTETLSTHEMVESQVRRCKGGSSKKSVECAINAKTLDDLRACDFYKVPENATGIGADPGAGSAGSAGSATGSAGSASGSGETGSAGADAAGSAAGSAGSAAAGAAGSAAAGSTGSAAEGSAAGSAGSAAPAP